MTQTEIIQILAGFVGSIGFAILFNIRGKSLIATAIGGLFSWLLFVILSKYIKNEPFVYFIIACVISTYAEIMARVLKTPTSAFITTSLIPLIPGGSLYYTMVHAFEGDLHAFLPKAIYIVANLNYLQSKFFGFYNQRTVSHNITAFPAIIIPL